MASPEALLITLEDLGNKELKKFQWFLHQATIKEGCLAIPKCRLEDADRQDTVDEMVKTYGQRGAVEITTEILRKINRNDLVEYFSNIDLESIDSSVPKPEPPALTTPNQNSMVQTQKPPGLTSFNKDSLVPSPKPVIEGYHCKLQSNLQNKYMCVPEGSFTQKGKKHLDDIYTDLYVTEGHSIDINRQHEVRQIEATLRKPPVIMDNPLQPREMFKPSSGAYTPIRTVLTNGIAGIGKTFLVHKFILDWANGTSNQDMHFLFPFTFRQLNLLKGKRISLTELIHTCIRETIDIKEDDLNSIFTMLQTSGNSNYDKSEYKMMFVLDGLDESRLQLDFTSDDKSSVDIREANTVDVLLTNLIKGIFLPSVRIWITTRPAAAKQIPSEYVDVFTEVRGFTDQQKDTYFRKRFKEETVASRIISHIKTSRSVHIMCHIPVFCWITATVLEDVYKTEEEERLPKTLTEMYTKFLVFQIKQTTLKYGSEKSIKCIQSLAKLAFHQLQKGNLIFYESDLKKSGLNYNEVSVYSGVCTQIFKREYGLQEDMLFSFIHLSIQEYLAALYVVLSLINNNKNVINEEQQQSFPHLRVIFRKVTATEVLLNAVDKAIQSENGQLDLFLRFLLGLSMETNQNLLLGLLKQTGCSSQTNQEIARYIKKRIRENLCPERILNLFHCLNEMNDNSLVEEIHRYLTSGTLDTIKPSATEWSALTFVLLTSNENLDVFDLGKYCRSEDAVLERMLPLVKASTTTLLRHCELSSQCCGVLASVLKSATHLKELDLTANALQDKGIQLLAAGLGSPNCRLETLRLSGCQITEEGCASLALALRTNPLHLRNLDLSHNNLLDVGVQQLLPGLGHLKTLRLKLCGLWETCCQYLASVLSSTLSNLRELDLCDNDLQDIGVKMLSAGLESKHCRLEILRLSGCMITEAGCASLSSALKCNPSYLRVLDLSYNHPGSSGVTLLSDGLEDPNWKLEILNVDHGGEIRIKPGPRKYACQLTLDLNTAERHLLLSEGYRKVTRMNEEQPYPDHPERFQCWDQVLCRESLSDRCYWEVECKGVVGVGVTYRGIGRKARDNECRLGRNDKSWSLYCNRPISWHNGKAIVVSGGSSPRVERAGLHLDWPAGTVSFYNVSFDTPIHIHTFHATFREPLYPMFMVVGNGSSAFLNL